MEPIEHVHQRPLPVVELANFWFKPFILQIKIKNVFAAISFAVC